ncbi:MAG: class I tRNA ligase family protein, partial [Phycisphaeraceae bacterium]
MKYDPNQIEPRWQQHWAQHKTFHAPNPDEERFSADKPKFYVLGMFPYPSGTGLHVGHPLGYIATDIVARYKRMRGWNVLHPMGFDAFGLPAEQYAIETGVHPRETTENNIQTMLQQFQRLGMAYDWDRKLATTDVEYYKWTQWIFLQLYNSWFDPFANIARPVSELEQQLRNGEYEIGPDGELLPVGASGGIQPVAGGPVGARKWHELTTEQQRHLIDEYRLAYLAEVPVNWCPALGTVLANEEVTNEGRSERGNHPVYQRPLKQWMLRITAYAERLIEDLDPVDWPEPIKQMQRNWIGRSEGARVEFPLERPPSPTGGADADDTETITVFTTRPDTLFGATYMVLAPEHPLVDAITTGEQYPAVNEYRNQAVRKTALDRAAEGKTKTGVFTGAYAINPVNNERIPIWIAEYVMMDVGTGAIMAVPAHDERDFEFATQNDLPIRAVVQPADVLRDPDAEPSDTLDSAFTGEGENINSANEEISLNGLFTPDAKRTITDWLEGKGIGQRQVQYKLRDWLFSRQRYWGEPFPIVHSPTRGPLPLDESELPVELPEMTDFRPAPSDESGDAEVPKPPLDRAPDEWKYVEKSGERCVRELNTMPQWAGSCWYYLRFCDPRNDERFIGEEAEAYWMTPAKPREERSDSPGYLTPAPHGGVDLY